LTAQVIGATDRLGGEPVRPVHFGEDFTGLAQFNRHTIPQGVFRASQQVLVAPHVGDFKRPTALAMSVGHP
jgi:hypothetical protein